MNYLFLNKYGNAFPIWNELFWDFIFKDKMKCGNWFEIVFKWLSVEIFYLVKDILEGKIIWENYLESDDVAHLYW